MQPTEILPVKTSHLKTLDRGEGRGYFYDFSAAKVSGTGIALNLQSCL